MRHGGLTWMVVVPLGDGLEMIEDIVANALGLLCITEIQRCCPLVGLLLKPGCPAQVEVELLAILVEVLLNKVPHIGLEVSGSRFACRIPTALGILCTSETEKLVVCLDGYRFLVHILHRQVPNLLEERIDGVAFLGLEVVAAILFEKERQLVLSIIEAIDAAHIRLLNGGIGVGPVAIVAYQAHGLGSKGGRKFDIAGSSLTILDGHSALAGATSIEMTAYRCYGTKGSESVVDGGQQHGVCTTARTTICSHAGSINVLACQGIVEQTLSTKSLISVSQRTLVRLLAHLQFRFAPSEGVVADADGTHAG